MVARRFLTTAGVSLGAVALLLTSATGGRAQVLPPPIQLPQQISVPPESTLPISDVLAFSGQATITGDNNQGVVTVAPLNCPLNDEPDAPAAVDLVGCGGNFGFTSSTCEGFSDGEGASACALNTGNTGTFNNLVCGTGYASGVASITGGADAGESVTFGIVFVATIGVVTGNLTDTADGDGSGTDYVVGLVQLGPPILPGVPAPGDCTSAFTITSADVAFDL